MFERYTERAKRAIFWSRYIASQGGSPEIEPEHLLLGLLREDQGLARRFLESPWAVDSVWRQVAQSESIGEEHPDSRTDLPFSNVGKRALALTEEEADRLSSKHIGTAHLLLGLLREEKCFAVDILRERGVSLASTREELTRMPHDDSVTEEFVREPGLLPEVIELQTRITSIMSRTKDAIASHDFARARSYADEERAERNRLYLLCQQHRLSDWLYA